VTKSWVKADEVRRHVPPGRNLPTRFDDFLQAEPPFRVEWNDLDAYSLKPSATTEAVPFLQLPDGALVALWYHAAVPAVVLIGAHGELKVVARDFDDFLKAVAARSSGLPDFDEAEGPFRVPGKGAAEQEGASRIADALRRLVQTAYVAARAVNYARCGNASSASGRCRGRDDS
jgi:hypothetical protein